jgi:hypothetical protein
MGLFLGTEYRVRGYETGVDKSEAPTISILISLPATVTAWWAKGLCPPFDPQAYREGHLTPV